MAIENIDWPSAVTLLGTVGIVAGTLYRLFKKEQTWKDPVYNIKVRLTAIEEKIKNLEESQGKNDKYSDDKSKMFTERIDNAERKIEKLTDILIKYIGRMD